MTLQKIELNESKISEIAFHNTVYEAGFIAIRFASSSDEVERQHLFNSLTQIKMEYIRGEAFLIIPDYKHCRTLMDLLKKLGLITLNDYPQVGVINQAIEKLIDQRKTLTLSQSSSQCETIYFIADPYVSDILEFCNDYTTATILLCSSFSMRLDKVSIMAFIECHGLKSNLMESIEALWKIRHGQANLESTFIRMAKKIPTQITQRINLANFVIKELLKKFNTLSDPDAFCMVLTVKLLTPENTKLTPFMNTKQLILDALGDGPSANQARIYFEGGWGLNGVDVMSNNVFVDINILTKEGHDLERMRVLQQHFKSQIIDTIVYDIEHPPWATKEAKQDREISRAIRTNDFTTVDTLLACNPSWLARYIDDTDFIGNTPLIIALKYANFAMTQKILLAGKAVFGGANIDIINMPTKHNIFTPILVAIKSGSLEKLKLVLDHGANVHLPCGPRHKKSEVYKGNFFENTTPLQLVLDLFDEDKSAIHANMVKMLITAGANPNLTITDGTNAQQIANTVQQHEVSKVGSEINSRFQNVMIQISKAFSKKLFDYLCWTIFQDAKSNQYYTQSKAFTHEADGRKNLQLLQNQFPCAFLKPDQLKFRLCIPDLAQRLIEVNIGEKLRLLSAKATPCNKKYEDLVQQAKSCGCLNHPGLTTNKTALHQAACRGNLEKVEVLLKAGADPSKKDSDGYTAWDHATQNSHEAIAAILCNTLQNK